MRIAIDGRYIDDHYPGIGRYTYNLVRALAQLMLGDLLYVCVRPGAENTRFDMAALAGETRVQLVPVSPAPGDPRQQRVLAGLARELALDLFHTPTYSLPWPMPCPVVVTLHDVIPLVCPETLAGWPARQAYRLLIRRALRRSAAVLVDSQATKRDLAAFFPPGHDVTVVPLAVDAVFRRQTSSQVDAALTRLAMPRPYMLCVGTNKAHKNLPALLAAWADLPEDARAGHTLVWAGPQEPRRGLEPRLVRENATVMRWLGPVAEADLGPLYSGATGVVVPSLCEGFGLPVLEAMACGTPVACSDRSALPEAAGDAALYFDPTQPVAIQAAIARLLADADLRRSLTERGLVRAQECTWERTAQATRDVYRGMLKGGGGVG